MDQPEADICAVPLVTRMDEWLAQRAARHGATDLTSTQISILLDDLARHAGLGAHANALRPEAGRRSWRCLFRAAHLDVWVIAWTGGCDTGWHDHDSSSGALRVLEGVVTQERPRWGAPSQRQHVPAGQGLSFGPDHVHRITVAEERAVSLHAYSPPLRRMGQYSLDPSGALQRRTITYEEELQAASPV